MCEGCGIEGFWLVFGINVQENRAETYLKGFLDALRFILKKFQPASSHGGTFRSTFHVFLSKLRPSALFQEVLKGATVHA